MKQATPVRVVYGPEHPLDYPGTAQRDHDCAGFEASRGRFGEQRLVGQVRARAGERHDRLAQAQQPFQAQRGVQAAVAAADDQDPRSVAHHFLQGLLVKTSPSCKGFPAMGRYASPPRQNDLSRASKARNWRRERWPQTSSPCLLINKQTAMTTRPVSQRRRRNPPG